jgi:hypothetical protein
LPSGTSGAPARLPCEAATAAGGKTGAGAVAGLSLLVS